jgi:hypothetical protein
LLPRRQRGIIVRAAGERIKRPDFELDSSTRTPSAVKVEDKTIIIIIIDKHG